MMPQDQLQAIIEAALMAYDEPMNTQKLLTLFADTDEPPQAAEISQALESLQGACETRGIELVQVASGWRYQAKQAYAPWLKTLWQQRPVRYTQAFLETLSIITYRQPVTRAEIEGVRGVAVNPNIVKSLIEREWVKVVGHRDVPGRPELLGTTKTFLDYFNLKNLSELPSLKAIADLDIAGSELENQLQLLVEEQAQVAVELDKAAADAIEAQIARQGIELIDEAEIEAEIQQLEQQLSET